MFRKYANRFWLSFPMQLLALHIKRNHFLLLFWILVLLLITGKIGSGYGVHLLFLDPEYLGNVGFISFSIIGIAFGIFFIVWNITGYILNAHYFSFLATLNRPFGTYCLNNAILPLLFFIIYVYRVIGFQAAEGLLSLSDIAVRILGFICGLVLIISLSMLYFFRTNKQIVHFLKPSGKKSWFRFKVISRKLDPHEATQAELGIKPFIQIDTFINHNFQIRLARSASHYPASVIRSVYKQHHLNALFIELFLLITLIMFSLLIDFPAFRIPAAASILLLLTLFIMLIGACSYWLGKWKLFAIVLLLIILNLFMKHNSLQYENKAFGIHYQPTSAYNYEAFPLYADSASIAEDKQQTIEILNNWKQKFSSQKTKPKMIFINCSGGGLRSAMFTMKILQQADSSTQHALMQHAMLFTGASGGMIAAAYYRELYLRKLNGDSLNLTDEIYTENISKDLLNAVGFTLLVNDSFYPFQKFYSGDTKHRKDRGYIFEEVLNDNTEHILDKPIGDYKIPEQQAQIPMMLFYPTIVNDERKLFIGAQNFSYLSLPEKRKTQFAQPEIGGFDIHQLLKENHPDSIAFTSVLRMNCTFPYILPNVHLPTEPEIEVMDAGMRDNYGIQTSTAFISVFKDWINANTSGIILVNIRGIEQIWPVNENVSKGLIEKFISPIGTLYDNWVEIQDYQNEQLLNMITECMDQKTEVITFQYTPPDHAMRASLSFHLTAREKRDVLSSASTTYNDAALQKLKMLLQR